MGEISVSKSTWDSVVTSAGSGVDNVNTKLKVSISKTTLSPFKDIPDLISKMTGEFSKYKVEARKDTNNMKVVAQIKANQDVQIAHDIKRTVRFPNV